MKEIVEFLKTWCSEHPGWSTPSVVSRSTVTHMVTLYTLEVTHDESGVKVSDEVFVTARELMQNKNVKLSWSEIKSKMMRRAQILIVTAEIFIEVKEKLGK